MERNSNVTLVLETALGAFRLPVTALHLDEALKPAQGSGSIQVKVSVAPVASKVADAMTSKALPWAPRCQEAERFSLA